MSARILLWVGAYVIPLTSVSEKEIGGMKGGSGYGRLGGSEESRANAEKGSKICFPRWKLFSV